MWSEDISRPTNPAKRKKRTRHDCTKNTCSAQTKEKSEWPIRSAGPRKHSGEDKRHNYCNQGTK